MIAGYANATDLSTTISGLQEYVEYNISVRAYTSVGPGPLSPTVTNRTFEDGMSLFTIQPTFLRSDYLLFSFIMIAPGASPQGVRTPVISSSEIAVIWEEVEAIDRNGIIVMYEVRADPLQFSEMLTTLSINATNMSTSITGLEAYVLYNISVRAYTSVGPGPYSLAITSRTFEDGEVNEPQVY